MPNAYGHAGNNGHLGWPLVFLPPDAGCRSRRGTRWAVRPRCSVPARTQLKRINFLFATMDINKQLAALTTSELQTAGASQATAIAVSVLLRHLQSPELSKLLTNAFENHQAVMLQTPWPDQMLQSFESTRRFLEGAAKPFSGDEAARGAAPAQD
jgi:hypothetical protein